MKRHKRRGKGHRRPKGDLTRSWQKNRSEKTRNDRHHPRESRPINPQLALRQVAKSQRYSEVLGAVKPGTLGTEYPDRSKRLKGRIDSFLFRTPEDRRPYYAPRPAALVRCGLCGAFLRSREDTLEHQDKVHGHASNHKENGSETPRRRL